MTRAAASPGCQSARGSDLRWLGRIAGKLIQFFLPLTLAACAGGGWFSVPRYEHYYFYEPRVALPPASPIRVEQDGATIDMEFGSSENTLSLTTMPSRGNRELALGGFGSEAGYTGVRALDALKTERVPMRLWVAASCRAEDWVLLPSALRIVDPADSTAIPLTDHMQPIPAVLHPDSQVLTVHWRYAQLDPNREIRCPRGGTVAFTIGFEAALSRSSVKVIFENGIQREHGMLHIPDVELSLAARKTYKSEKRVNVLEVLMGAAAGFAH